MSRGPVIPAKCSTIQLSDLADVLDFDKEGAEEVTYGFEINQDGLYVRKEIEERNQQFPKLVQIRDLNIVRAVDGAQHELIRNGNKWQVRPIKSVIFWPIKIEFRSPFTMIGYGNIFRKSLNQGPLIVSLVPEQPETIIVDLFRVNKYLIKRQAGAPDPVAVFKPETALGNQWSMVWDIKLPQTPRQVSMKLMQGINLTWGPLPEAKRGQIFIQKRNEGEVLSNNNIQGLDVTVKFSISSLDKILLNDLSLIGFYYTNELLSESQINSITF